MLHLVLYRLTYTTDATYGFALVDTHNRCYMSCVSSVVHVKYFLLSSPFKASVLIELNLNFKLVYRDINLKFIVINFFSKPTLKPNLNTLNYSSEFIYIEAQKTLLSVSRFLHQFHSISSSYWLHNYAWIRCLFNWFYLTLYVNIFTSCLDFCCPCFQGFFCYCLGVLMFLSELFSFLFFLLIF